MKSVVSVLVLLHFFFGHVAAHASTNATMVAEHIALISPCGMRCLQATAPVVGCSTSDYECQCSNNELSSLTGDCLRVNCTISETLQVSKAYAAICERPDESRRQEIVLVAIVCAVITNGAIIAKLLIRYLLKQGYGIDDLFAILSVLGFAVWTSLIIQFEENGLGDHIWTIGPSSIPTFLYWFFITEVVYALSISTIKISVLFFYLRIFPKRYFRIVCYTCIAAVFLYFVAITSVTIFQCTPVSFVWDKSQPGHCLNYTTVAWINGGVNIAQGLVIVLLPINELHLLQLNARKKALMYAMFGIGLLVVLISAVRLSTLHSFGMTTDPTWDNVSTIFWTTLELSIAILCACLPTIRAGVARSLPKIAKWTGQDSDSSRVTEVREIKRPVREARISALVRNSVVFGRGALFRDGPDSPSVSVTSLGAQSRGRSRSREGRERVYEGMARVVIIQHPTERHMEEVELMAASPLLGDGKDSWMRDSETGPRISMRSQVSKASFGSSSVGIGRERERQRSSSSPVIHVVRTFEINKEEKSYMSDDSG